MKKIIVIFMLGLYHSESLKYEESFGQHWTTFPDEDGKLHHINLDPDKDLLDSIVNNQIIFDDTRFWLYTRNNVNEFKELYINSTKNRKYFLSGKPTIIVTHGWTCSGYSNSTQYIKNEYLKNFDVNVIIVDWSSKALSAYGISAFLTGSVGKDQSVMISIVLIVVSIILILVYLNGKYNETYWKRRNVAFYSRNKVMGPFWDYLTTDKSFFEGFRHLYKTYRNEPAVGVGAFLTPTLFVVDPVNLQHVLSTDFKSFNHRGIETNKDDILADNILFMYGNRWKLMRQNMTPLFTTTKLKSMYYIIENSATDFVKHLKNNPDLWKGNTYDTLSTFCSAAIGAAVFGVGTNSIFDSPFLDMARNALKPTFIRNLKFSISGVSNTLFKALNLKIFSEHEQFFVGAIKEILKEREQQNTKKHDFADTCLALKKAGHLVDKSTGLVLEPTDELLAAQAFFFFVAGVEPTASAIFSTLVELGRHPQYLEQLHEEIDETFDKNDNKLSFDVITQMKFLDMAFSEALRMYPPIGFLTRQCVSDTVLPVGNIKVDKGTKVFTPIYDVQYDERFYPEPEVYKPERFAPENRHAISDVNYMPFGGGNRICVGMRYASLQAKAGLVYLLRHFTVKTLTYDGGIKFSKEQVQVRLSNVDVELIPRKNITA